MIQIRQHLKYNCAGRIYSGDVDAYILAIAVYSNDGGKWRDKDGVFYYAKL